MKNIFTLFITSCFLTLLSIANLSAQTDVRWEKGSNSNAGWGNGLSRSGNSTYNDFGFGACPHYDVSENRLWQCLEGFAEARFEVYGGVTPASNIEWIFGLDEQLGGFTHDYAIRVWKDAGVYKLQVGTSYNPCVSSFTGPASLATVITFDPSDKYRIARTRNGENDHTITFYRNGTSLYTVTQEPDKSLAATASLDKIGALVVATSSFDGACFNQDEDWKGASTGTLTPFVETDNVNIPAQLSVGTIPQDITSNHVLVEGSNGAISYQDISSIGQDVDWQTNSNTTPSTLSDDIYKMGTVGIGITANQARLHVNDIACDNLPAFRVSGPGVSTACAFPDVHGHLIQAESYDNLGFMVPRFVTTYDGRVGIGTGAPAYTLHVNGNIYAAGSYFSSDQRFKNHIKPVDNALDLVMQLKGTTYTYRTSEFPERNFRNGTQYGFIAQELRNVLPELVDEDDDGYLAVDYVALIPILTEALKLQQTEIQELTARVNTLENVAPGNTIRNQGNGEEKGFGNLAEKATLGQNSPNPFTDKTSIHFFLPETIQQAHLVIFDMNGKQLEGYPVAQRGNNSLSLSLSHLGAGMFMYSLIADNQEVDTKRMILTE